MLNAMKNEIQKYPTYKDSGVEWIGEIPEYWEILKGKWLFVKEERPARKEDGIVTCFRDGEVTLRTNRKTEGFTIALKEHGYQGIRKGDLVIHNMDAFAGAIGISDSDGKSTPVYSACTSRIPNKVNSYYYAYFLKNLAKSGFIESLAKGIRERSTDFRFDDFGLLLLSVPPLPEQTAIADFLDRKTALIDQAIGIKHKQIDLLKERRQILIHKAVTRGLNPNAKMKDSGNDAVGDIPEHWQINKLRNCLKPVSIKNHPHLPLLSITRELGVIERNIDDPDENHNFIPEDLSGYKLIKTGQFGMNKMKAWQGSYGISQFTGIVSPAYFVFDLISDILPSFFHLAIRSKFYVPFFVQASDGVRIGQWDLSKERMKEIPIIIPPAYEQIQIVSFIDGATEKILIAINAKEQEIEKLKEYKATLINSAVTGKIKVC
jgi:type I restriction enzyme S subunit